MENQVKNELATVSSAMIPTSHEIQVYQVMARSAAQSQLYKTLSEPQIMAIMLAARELGIPPMLALNGGLVCIQGRVELSARLMGNMIRQRGHSFTVKMLDKTKCTLVGKRVDNGDSMEASFSWEDAKEAGLTGKQVWKSYCEDMLYARSLSRLARRLFPDVIGTAYVEGEIEIRSDIVVEPIIQPNPVEEKEVVDSFLADFPEEERELAREYVDKFSSHYKRSTQECIMDFRQNSEQFQAMYSKWKAKNSVAA